MNDGADSIISAEEYAHWLKPNVALGRLPPEWGRGSAIAALVTHLEVGSIKAVARNGLMTTESGQRRVTFYAINPEFWDDGQWVHGPEALWVAGNVSFHQGSRLAEVLRRPPERWVEHIFTGVRFDPAGFAESFGDPPKTASFSKPLAPAEIERFIKLYLELWATDAREMAALAAVQACYPEHSVSRDPFLAKLRELRGPGKRGTPATRGE